MSCFCSRLTSLPQEAIVKRPSPSLPDGRQGFDITVAAQRLFLRSNGDGLSEGAGVQRSIASSGTVFT
jgi:hypothetical protein